MNKKNIRGLALAILQGELAKRERNPIGFNLGPYFSEDTDQSPDKSGHNCGTVACIAGWAHFLHGGRSKNHSKIFNHAKEVLGLDDTKAYELFAPFSYKRAKVTPSDAALALFTLAETGKVDWSHVP